MNDSRDAAIPRENHQETRRERRLAHTLVEQPKLCLRRNDSEPHTLMSCC